MDFFRSLDTGAWIGLALCLVFPAGLLLNVVSMRLKGAPKRIVASVFPLALVGLTVLGCISMVLAGKRSGDASRRLDASISAYLADTSRLTRTNEQAYITGTLVFFDKATQTIPHSGSQLTVDPAIAYDAYQNPEGISMADIGTIIVVDYEDKKVFTYNDGTPAYQTTCDLTVVDKTRDAIVDQKSFIGPLPPSSFTCKIGAVNTCPDSVSGGYPSKEMKEYIDSLPPK